MWRARGIRFASVGLALAACAAAAVAGEGRTPIWAPTSIGVPGKYVVTRNITSPTTVIEVTVSGVDIDLNGMVLSTGGADPVILGIPGVGNVSVRNGRIAGGSEALSFRDGTSYTFEDLDIYDGGFGGVVVSGTEIAIRRLTITDRGGPAVLLDPGPFPWVTGVVADSIIVECGEGIIIDRASAFTVRNNEIERTFAGSGIRFGLSGGILVSENNVQEAAADGIFIEGTNNGKIYNNVVFRSGGAGVGSGHGIALMGGTRTCIVLDNVSTENIGAGLYVEGVGSHVENNLLNLNSSGGLVFGPGGDGNTYGRNTGRFNGPPAAPCAVPSACPSPDFCDDGGFGIGNTSRFDNVFGPPVC